MVKASLLIGGALALAAVVVLTLAIVAIAPYVAILIVGALLLWFFSKEEAKPPDLGPEDLRPPIRPVVPVPPRE